MIQRGVNSTYFSDSEIDKRKGEQMILIAHRGNISGPIPEKENKPYYIMEALAMGFDVEIDLWLKGDDTYWLGHDAPTDIVDEDFLRRHGLWIHCKNTEALQRCLDLGLHCFFHVTDNATLTSRGYVWVYPGKTQTRKSIVVMPEWNYGDDYEKVKNLQFYGVCSDYVLRYKCYETKTLHQGSETNSW